MKKLISIVFMFLMVTVSSFAFFRTSVAPGIFEMNLDRSATEEIILVNNSNDPIRVKIYPGKDDNIKDVDYSGNEKNLYKIEKVSDGEEKKFKISYNTEILNKMNHGDEAEDTIVFTATYD